MRVGHEQQRAAHEQQPTGARPTARRGGQPGQPEHEQDVTGRVGDTHEAAGGRAGPGVERRADQQVHEDQGGAGTDDPGLEPSRTVAGATVVCQQQECDGEQHVAEQVGGVTGRRVAVAVQEDAPSSTQRVSEDQQGQAGGHHHPGPDGRVGD